MVFIFKKEIFQLSIHNLNLNHNIYNIIHNYKSLKILVSCSGIMGIYKREQADIFINKCRSKQILI
jgi:hypothetical protein